MGAASTSVTLRAATPISLRVAWAQNVARLTSQDFLIFLSGASPTGNTPGHVDILKQYVEDGAYRLSKTIHQPSSVFYHCRHRLYGFP